MQIKHLLLWACLFVLSACQSTRIAQQYPWPATAVATSAQFKHLTLSQAGTQNTDRLHVYVEGDGVPFRNRFQIAKDPSPRYPLMKYLMDQDKTASLYLGRPCYYLSAMPAMDDPLCEKRYWTTARYSDSVVTSMINALQQYLADHPSKHITLLGHSGGGTLVMLMAARMAQVDQVVTLAGNLDINAWTSLHHYTPLNESLNPAELSKLPAKQLHYGGDKDDNIPPELSYDFLARIGQSMHVIKDADHNCCWYQHWGEMLNEINQQMNP